jgi:hypothetical protein
LDKWETAVLETTEVLAEVRRSRRARGN